MNLREGRIGNQEAVAVTMLAAVLNTVFVTEGQRLYHSGNQTYLSVMASAALSLIVFLLAARAMAHRGLADLNGLLNDSFGRTVGSILGAGIALLLVISAAMPLIRVLYVLHRYIYVDAGREVIAVYLLAALLILTLFGWESLGRLAKLCLFPTLAAFLVVLLSGIPDYAPYRLYPLLGGGTEKFLRASLSGVFSFLPPLLMLLICARGVHGPENAARLGAIALLFSGIFCMLVQLCLGLMFTTEELSRIYSPIYRLTMVVRFAQSMRLDKILLFFWIAAALAGMAALLYAASLQMTRSLRLKDVRPAVAALTGLGATITLFGHYNIDWFEKAMELLLQYQWLGLASPILAASIVGLCRRESKLCKSVG